MTMNTTHYANIPTNALTDGSVAFTSDWMWMEPVPPSRPNTVLKARIEVDEDGALHLIPEDAAAAFFLHDRALNHSIRHEGTANGPGKPFRFTKLTIARKDAPTLTKDGSRSTEQRLLPQDYDAAKKFLVRLAEKRAKAAVATPAKRRPKTRPKKRTKRGGK